METITYSPKINQILKVNDTDYRMILDEVRYPAEVSPPYVHVFGTEKYFKDFAPDSIAIFAQGLENRLVYTHLRPGRFEAKAVIRSSERSQSVASVSEITKQRIPVIGVNGGLVEKLLTKHQLLSRYDIENLVSQRLIASLLCAKRIVANEVSVDSENDTLDEPVTVASSVHVGSAMAGGISAFATMVSTDNPYLSSVTGVLLAYFVRYGIELADKLDRQFEQNMNVKKTIPSVEECRYAEVLAKKFSGIFQIS